MNLERVVADRSGLAHQLIEPLPRHRAIAVGGGIDAVGFARCRAVNRLREAARVYGGTRTKHHVEIAGMEPIGVAALAVI